MQKKFGMETKNLSYTINQFLLFKKTSSFNTVKSYAYALKKFAVQMPENLDKINVEMLEIYFLRKSKIWKPSTVNLHIYAVKSFYRWLQQYNNHVDLGQFIHNVPALPIEQRILSRSEYNLVCGYYQPQSYQANCFKFLCNTGLRVTEFVKLTKENISHGFVRVVGKGRKNRSVPLNKIAFSIVGQYPEFSFIKRRNHIWLWRLCKKIGSDVGIPPFHPHSCRHYFANELYHRGVDMYTISRLLGHADTKVTENVYVHWQEEMLKGVTDVLEG